MSSKIGNIYSKLGDNLLEWAEDLDQLLYRLSKKLTASSNFITNSIKRQVEKFYELVQETLDATYDILLDNGLSKLTPAWEQEILKELKPKLDKLQINCKRIHATHKGVLDQIPKEMKDELEGICFDIQPNDVLNIVKGFLKDGN